MSALHPTRGHSPLPFVILPAVPPNLVSRDVSTRGVRIRVNQIGAGPPVLLLHGLFTSSLAFDDILSPLAQSFHVITVDLPAFGESEKPPPARFSFSVESCSEVVADVIAALGVGRCHLIGHAIGGSVALTLAAEHPEFVDHLVLVAPWIHPHPLPRLMRLVLLPVIGSFSFKQLLSRRTFRAFFHQHVYAPGHAVPPARIDRYYDALNSPPAREGAHAFLASMIDTRPSIARLARIKSPTLVVWGRSDALLSPQAAPRIVRQIANARLEYVDSGHSPHEEAPGEFVNVVDRFLVGHP